MLIIWMFLGGLLFVTLAIWVIGFVPKFRKGDQEELVQWFKFPVIFLIGLAQSILLTILYLTYLVSAILTVVLSGTMNLVYIAGVSYNPMSKGRKWAHYAMAARNILLKKDIEDSVEKERERWQKQHDTDKLKLAEIESQKKYWEKQAKKIRQEYFVYNQKVQGAVQNAETFKYMKNTIANNVVPQLGQQNNQNQNNQGQKKQNGNGGGNHNGNGNGNKKQQNGNGKK